MLILGRERRLKFYALRQRLSVDLAIRHTADKVDVVQFKGLLPGLVVQGLLIFHFPANHRERYPGHLPGDIEQQIRPLKMDFSSYLKARGKEIVQIRYNPRTSSTRIKQVAGAQFPRYEDLEKAVA